MMRFALLLLPAALLAQLTPNSVTVTASRNTLVPADQIVFNVTLTASPDAGFDEVLAAVSGAGLTEADFRGVGFAYTMPPAASWLFVKTAPLTDQKATVGLLTALQQSLAREKKHTLAFQVGGSQLSAAAQQQSQKCPLTDLVAEARTRAANLAAASGATAGAIQMLAADTATCSLTARFALGGVGQAGPGSVAITARNVASTAAPNRIGVTLTVSADLGVGLDQVVQAAAPTGVTTADLLGVSQPYIGRVCVANITTPCNPVEWIFRYTAPLSKWKDTLAALTRARDAKHPGITIGYGISADAPPAPECALPTLVSQARRRAQEVADAAGVGLGALSAVSEGPPLPQLAIPTLAIRSGDFSFYPSTGVLTPDPMITAILTPYPVATYASGCSAIAQFVMTP